MTIRRKPNRRDFVRGSAVAAGMAITGGLSVAHSVHAAGGDQIKIALIGCGGRGTGAASQCLSVIVIFLSEPPLAADTLIEPAICISADWSES